MDNAKAALWATIDGDGERASAHLDALIDEDGPRYPAIPTAVVVWAEMLRDHIFDGNCPEGLELPGGSVVDENGTEYVLGSAHADTQVPPEFLWAARILGARLTFDRPAFERVWNEAPSDEGVFGDYVLAVLHTCARTIMVEPRGYGWQYEVPTGAAE